MTEDVYLMHAGPTINLPHVQTLYALLFISKNPTSNCKLYLFIY